METLLMCNPAGFAVRYEINPWMRDQIGRVSPELALQQWQGLSAALAEVARIEVMPPDPAWPDLVFTANAGLPLPWKRQFILSNFRHPQRQGEKPVDRAWFAAAGWQCVELPGEAIFEGAGDALFDLHGRLWIGGGPRSSAATPECLAQFVDGPIHTLTLADPAFYHLDTCFCPLPTGGALHVPRAFDEDSRRRLAEAFGDTLIALTPEEGRLFCANAVCVADRVFMNRATPRLAQQLATLGLAVTETPLSEFMKSGGSAKCLTLNLDGWMYGRLRRPVSGEADRHE